MLTVVGLVLCCLLANAHAQVVPFRFDLAIQRLNQHQQYSFADLMDKEVLEFTPQDLLASVPESLANNQSSECARDLQVILQAVEKRDQWALKVLDAWGKPLPSGLLKGNVYWVGSYDECVNPMYLPANKSLLAQPFNTQYCTVSPKSAQAAATGLPGLVLGICVPASCDRSSVVSLVRGLFKNSSLTENDVHCSDEPANGQKSLTGGAIGTIIVVSILGATVLLGTLMDILSRSQTIATTEELAYINGATETESIKSFVEVNRVTAFLMEFSALKSLGRIFTMKQRQTDDSFTFINGMRVLSLCWVIIGHTMVFSISYSSNVVDLLSWTRNVLFQLIINAVLSVDTFFVLSGFLTSVLFVRHVKKEGALTPRFMFLYYVHRYIRLTPTFLLMVFISIHLTPYFGHGPLYPTQQGFEVPQCRSKSWWTSIAYVGNIVQFDGMCLPIAWYLHNDMQFHWIAPLALIPFAIGRKSVSIFITVLMALTGSVTTLSILLYYPSISLNTLTAFGTTTGPSFFEKIYITPWCRISPYAIGMLTGYMVMECGRQYRIHRYSKVLGSILMTLIALACLFATYPDYILPEGLSRPVLLVYQTLSRPLWSMAVGWLLFVCSINQGGVINQVLSWPVWAPLARLNYSCYLVHATVIYISVFNQMMPVYYQGHLFVNAFVSYIVLSYTASIVVAIFFETPFFILEKRLFKR